MTKKVEASDSSSKVPTTGAQSAEAAKPQKTRKFRGQECPITKVTKNTRTGAIYDHILYTRSVTNRRTGEAGTATVGHKLRRPGTGIEPETNEIELVEE